MATFGRALAPLLALSRAPGAFAEPSPTRADATTTSSTVDGFSLAAEERQE